MRPLSEVDAGVLFERKRETGSSFINVDERAMWTVVDGMWSKEWKVICKFATECLLQMICSWGLHIVYYRPTCFLQALQLM